MRLMNTPWLSLLLALTVASCGQDVSPRSATPKSSASATAPVTDSRQTATSPKQDTPTPAPIAVPTNIAILNVTLGNALNADKRVQVPTELFAKSDTIYAQIDAKGSGEVALKVQWMERKAEQAVLVHESSETIRANGPVTTVVQASKSDGWTSGNYQIAVFLNEAPIGTKRFRVN